MLIQDIAHFKFGL